jgi:hypothetical protein
MPYAIPHDRIFKIALPVAASARSVSYNAEDPTCINNYDKWLQLDLAKAKELQKGAPGSLQLRSISVSRRRCSTTTTSPSSSPISEVDRRHGDLRRRAALQLLDAFARASTARTEQTGMPLNEGVIWLNDPSTSPTLPS